MRVIAGRLGGRPLRAPAGAGTRPTASRVREALFSILGDVEDVRALDLFAGSGALGIEALSRGAASVVFVERAPRALAALRANLEALGLPDAQAEVRPVDVLAALRSARGARETYDLVFIDPPYREAAGRASELGRAVAPVLAPAARVITESDRRSPLRLELGDGDERRYGDTLITIHHLP